MGSADNDKKGPIHMQQLLAPRADGLGGLLRKARAIETLTGQLRERLPETLRQGWAVGKVDERELVLVAESSAWATRLRYSRLLMLQTARELTGLPLPELKVKITPPSRKRAPKNDARMGSEAAHTLRQAAKGFSSSNPRLSRALERLARRAEGED